MSGSGLTGRAVLVVGGAALYAALSAGPLSGSRARRPQGIADPLLSRAPAVEHYSR
jgi:hypothetical protein